MPFGHSLVGSRSRPADAGGSAISLPSGRLKNWWHGAKLRGPTRANIRLSVMIVTMKLRRCSQACRADLSVSDNDTPAFYDRSHPRPLGHGLGDRLGRNQHNVTRRAWREAIVRPT